MPHALIVGGSGVIGRAVARQPGTRILNIADPDTPSALDISRTVARYLAHDWTEVLLDDHPLGGTPWDSTTPVVLDTSAAIALGYQPVGDYATTVAAQLDWLTSAARSGDISRILPTDDDPYFRQFFDYPAEDEFLAGR
ncbi:hypothetical protein [Nocardia sp. NPDC050412]|uniref:hypothetical protein n=1 Tax=Nocardia sp. NPDC050412 TaxID=3364320 RepID=UPI003794B5F0